MAAMKPRTGDGPLEVTREGRGIVMRVPLEAVAASWSSSTPREAGALGMPSGRRRLTCPQTTPRTLPPRLSRLRSRRPSSR